MGNCMAVEAVAVVVEHPEEGRVERLYWSLAASSVMDLNPGHYIALVTTDKGRCFELLRPDNTLHVGRVYRLVSFQETLKELESKTKSGLSRRMIEQENSSLLVDEKERIRGLGCFSGAKWRCGFESRLWSCSGYEFPPASERMDPHFLVEEKLQQEAQGIGSGRFLKYRQWRPTLQSIIEGES